MLLVNAFYVTYGSQTIIFAIFVSMNPPKRAERVALYSAVSAIGAPLLVSRECQQFPIVLY